jgi:LysM repeat protein
VRAIAEVNNLDDDDDTLPRDAKLIIPVTGKGGEEAVAYSKQVVRYRVRPGDTVLSVADDWGVPPAKIRLWNHLKGNRLVKGRVLYIHRPLDSNYHPATGETAMRSSRRSRLAKKSADAASKSHKTKPNASKGGEDVASLPANGKRTAASNEQH